MGSDGVGGEGNEVVIEPGLREREGVRGDEEAGEAAVRGSAEEEVEVCRKRVDCKAEVSKGGEGGELARGDGDSTWGQTHG